MFCVLCIFLTKSGSTTLRLYSPFIDDIHPSINANIYTYTTTYIPIYNRTVIHQIPAPERTHLRSRLTYSLHTHTFRCSQTEKETKCLHDLPIHAEILTSPRVRPPFEPASERLPNNDPNRSSIRRATALSREAEISGNFDD